ncbi:hypothetical protein B0H13DRAFT_2684870 [Mycena leptocephala]|nr:hypothetical protein B0H13DRAFT_2684870 [Mycena leptocephala]
MSTVPPRRRAPTQPIGRVTKPHLSSTRDVYLRQDNDAVNARLAELEALNAQLQQQVKDSSKLAPDVTDNDGEEVSDALAKEREENARLRKQLEQARTDRESAIVTDTPEMIPRPRGTAGNDYSTEVEMQLGDTADNHDAFKGIQRTLRDLVLQARINWEVQWSEVPRPRRHSYMPWRASAILTLLGSPTTGPLKRS